MCGIHIPVNADDEEFFQEMEIEQEPLFAYPPFPQMTPLVLGCLFLSNRKY